MGDFTSLEGYASPTGVAEVMTDVVTPNFERRRNNGEVLFNGMEHVTTQLTSDSRSHKLEWIANDAAKGTTFDLSGDFLLMFIGGKVASSTSVPALKPGYQGNPNELQRAIREACTKAQKGPSEASLLVSLAEFDKTLRLVPDLLKNWSSLFQKLNRVAERTRNFSELTNARRLSASNLSALERSAMETWLAIRFGVRPLIMDTLGIIKALNGEDAGKPVRVSTRGKAYTQFADTATSYGTYGAIRVDFTEQRNYSANVRAMMLWELELTKLRNLGVSLSAIPEAAIDLVRFSFVLNWVVNVNDFFAALGSMLDPGLTPLGGCYTLDIETSSLWMPTATTSVDARLAVTRPVSGVILATTLQRRRIVGLESPKLTVRAAPLAFLGDLRIVDAIALLRTNLRGRGVKAVLDAERKTTHVAMPNRALTKAFASPILLKG